MIHILRAIGQAMGKGGFWGECWELVLYVGVIYFISHVSAWWAGV